MGSGTFAPTDILRICPRDYSPRDYFRPQKLHVVIYVKVCGLFFEDFCKILAVLSIIVVPLHLKIEEMIVNKLKIDEKF